MQKFIYKAYDSSLNIVTGEIEEEEIELAREKIKVKGLSIIDIRKKTELKNLRVFKRKMKNEEVAAFCGQMATIINAGLNIINGLEIIKMQNKNFKEEIDSIIKYIRSGETLGTSIEATGYFPKLLTDMVKSGELSGNVDEVLFNMEEYYEREAYLRSKVKNASIYPSIMLFVSIAMLLFFNYFIFGKLGDIYTDNENLPAISKVLLVFMNIINNNFIQVIILIVLLIILAKYIKKVDKVKYLLDTMLLRLPVIGKLNSDIITNRFSRSMAIFLRSAVPILAAFESMELVIGNMNIAKKIAAARSEIVTGARIADSLEKEKMLDPLALEMLRIGEETGKLEEMLNRLALIYDKRVEQGISKVMALVEPAFTLIIGLIVGFVVIGMALPILQMSNTIK